MNNSNYTILIAEDEADLLEICTDIFEIEDFNVVGVRNGKQALEAFLSKDIDLILSDSNMPEMDGLELLSEVLKSDKRTPPFFLLTGDITLSEEELKDKGVTSLISKPFDLDEIIGKVIRTLREK